MQDKQQDKTNMAHPIQVAILEDHPVFRAGLKLSLGTTCHVCLEESHGELFLVKIATAKPDIVILDLILPDISGIEVAKRLREEYTGATKILVMSIDTREDTIEQLLDIGIDGFLSKEASGDTLREAVKTIVAGGTYFSRPKDVIEREILISFSSKKPSILTEREYDVMLAFCKGMSCSEVAEKMFIAPKTVDNHKQHIFAKLGIHNVVQLVIYAIRNKIIVL